MYDFNNDYLKWHGKPNPIPDEYIDEIVAQTIPKLPKRNWTRLMTGELLTHEEDRHYIRTGEMPNRRPIYTLERFRREVLPDAVD